MRRLLRGGFPRFEQVGNPFLELANLRPDFPDKAVCLLDINTPPTYAIYICGLVLKWLKRQGGVDRMEQASIEKSSLLYNFIDGSDFYRNDVAADSRSRMNVPFFLADESLNEAFTNEAAKKGILQIKGHRAVGGMRASLYNAMPVEGVRALIAFMQAFQQNHRIDKNL